MDSNSSSQAAHRTRSGARATVAFLVIGVLAVMAPPAFAATSSGSGDRMCAAFEKIGELDLEFDEVLAEADDWETARDEMERLNPVLRRAWKKAVKTVPDEYVEDAKVVAGYTKRTIAAMLKTDSLTEAGLAALDDPDLVEAGLASFRLDEFSRDECDVSINNEAPA
jgi:hypothetical protein